MEVLMDHTDMFINDTYKWKECEIAKDNYFDLLPINMNNSL